MRSGEQIITAIRLDFVFFYILKLCMQWTTKLLLGTVLVTGRDTSQNPEAVTHHYREGHTTR
jgi:hypothetical protein